MATVATGNAKRLLKAKEVAEYIGMSTKRLHNRVNDGSLPAALKPVRVGKRGWRWDRLRIDVWLEEERRKAEEGASSGEHAS